MRCQICGRKAESKFCKLHEDAYRNLVENYEVWKRSMNISWTEYLDEAQKNQYTGIWVKEVAQSLLRSGSSEREGKTGER